MQKSQKVVSIFFVIEKTRKILVNFCSKKLEPSLNPLKPFSDRFYTKSPQEKISGYM